MTTAEQLLASMTEIDKTFVIDNDLRTINVPASITNLGVESDDDVLTVQFQMPGTYCGIDLSKFNIRINYLNAAGEGDYHDVDDAAVQPDGTIRFSWTIGRHAASVVGNVEFNICLKKTDSSGKVLKEFNTTPASLPILKGLEVSEQVISEYNDILEQWRAKLFGVGDTEEARLLAVSQEQQQVIFTKSVEVLSDIELKGSETLATIPDTYTEVYNMAEEAIRTKADTIVLEAEGSVISVDDSSNDHLQNLKVCGKTVQDGIPSPNAPVDLVNVENPTVDIHGKNLWNHDYDNLDMSSISGWGNAIWNNSAVTKTLKPNTTYALSFDVTALDIPEHESVFADNCGFTLFSNKASGAYIVMAHSIDEGVLKVGEKRTVKGTFTTPSNLLDASMDYTILRYTQRYINNEGTAVFATVKFENVQLELGTVATDYEPYKPIQSLTLNHTLPGIPVTSGGNYTDNNGQQWVCDEVDFNRGVYVQRINTITFTGLEGWYISAAQYSAGTRFDLNLKDVPVASHQDVLCNRFAFKGPNAGLNTIWILPLNAAFRIITDKASTPEELKQFLSNNLTTVMYVLSDPIETPLTSEEILAYKALKTNYPNTTVLNDSDAYMQVAYSADTLLFLRDHQKPPTDEQVTNAVNAYLDEHGVQIPSDEYINSLIDGRLSAIPNAAEVAY